MCLLQPCCFNVYQISILMAVFVVYSQDFVKQNGEPKVTSGKQEKYETVLNHYLWRHVVKTCLTMKPLVLSGIVSIQTFHNSMLREWYSFTWQTIITVIVSRMNQWRSLVNVDYFNAHSCNVDIWLDCEAINGKDQKYGFNGV